MSTGIPPQCEQVPVHLIWLGSAVPKSVCDVLERWSVKPEVAVRLWTEEDLEYLPNGPWRDHSLHPAQRADILRVKIIQLFGGWYADVDCEPGRSKFFAPTKVHLAIEDSRRFINAFFGAPKGHPFLDTWLVQMHLGLQDQCRPSIADATGPGALARAIYVHAGTRGAKSARQELVTLRWKEFAHIPGQLAKQSSASRPFSGLAIHVGEGSWLSASQDKRLKGLKRFIWELRHTSLGSFLDVLRLTVRGLVRPSMLVRPVSRHILFTSDINDSDVSLWASSIPVECNLVTELDVLLADVGVVQLWTDSQIVVASATRAGWRVLEAETGWHLLRPNVRHLAS